MDFFLWMNGEDVLKEKGFHMVEVPTDTRWIYQLGMFYENNFVSEHAVNFVEAQVPSIYDNHIMHVMENAYNFLEGKEELYCTAEDGYKALKYCDEIEHQMKIQEWLWSED